MASGNKEFGKCVKLFRERMNLTQEMLAEMVGLEYQTISRIETGLYFTSYENLIKLASALNVELKDFFQNEQLKKNRKDLMQSIKLILNSKTDDELKIIYEIVFKLDELTKPKSKTKRHDAKRKK